MINKIIQWEIYFYVSSIQQYLRDCCKSDPLKVPKLRITSWSVADVSCDSHVSTLLNAVWIPTRYEHFNSNTLLLSHRVEPECAKRITKNVLYTVLKINRSIKHKIGTYVQCIKLFVPQHVYTKKKWSPWVFPLSIYCIVSQWHKSPLWVKTSSLSRLHDHTQLDTTHSVRLLWTSDQPDAETSTWKHTTLKRDIHAPGGIQTHNPSKRTAEDPSVRRRGHWKRHLLYSYVS
jgi:hypothetical protein